MVEAGRGIDERSMLRTGEIQHGIGSQGDGKDGHASVFVYGKAEGAPKAKGHQALLVRNVGRPFSTVFEETQALRKAWLFKERGEDRPGAPGDGVGEGGRPHPTTRGMRRNGGVSKKKREDWKRAGGEECDDVQRGRRHHIPYGADPGQGPAHARAMTGGCSRAISLPLAGPGPHGKVRGKTERTPLT
jgi:hypothetical protein